MALGIADVGSWFSFVVHFTVGKFDDNVEDMTYRAVFDYWRRQAMLLVFVHDPRVSGCFVVLVRFGTEIVTNGSDRSLYFNYFATLVYDFVDSYAVAGEDRGTYVVPVRVAFVAFGVNSLRILAANNVFGAYLWWDVGDVVVEKFDHRVLAIVAMRVAVVGAYG